MSSPNADPILTLVYDIPNTNRCVRESIDNAYNNGYGLISYPLVESKHDTPKLITSGRSLSSVPFKYTTNSNSYIFQSVYGKLSEWITFNVNATADKRSCELLQHQLDWCLHLGIYSVMLPAPQSTTASNTEQKAEDMNTDNHLDIAVHYASALTSAFNSRCGITGIIPIKFNLNGWKLWKTLSILLRDIKCVRPALIIEKNLPPKELVQQWFAEGVQILLLPQDVFLTNKKGFPVLSKAHQKVLHRFLRWTDITIMITGADADNDGDSKLHAQYLRHLRSNTTPLNAMEVDAKPFWDVLQTPLQPLTHNLEYATYETFESDPIKYQQYEKAIVRCLRDLDKTTNGAKKEFIVMVLGAGRGPLVSAALRAQEATGVKIKLYAIEKNPHAVIILRNKNKTEWNSAVEIVAQDMRTWEYNEKAHVVISELLGSFGDNELSPECLDGAQRVLRDDGISIPAAYTSYLCPCTNNSVYSRLIKKPKDFETPYVIQLLRHSLLSKDIAKCWSFHHPNKESLNENDRFCKLTFKIDANVCADDGTGSVVHGFVGYFDSVLYKDVMISIHPQTASKEMFSWFPIYFPLMDPILCQKNDEITVCLWRKSDAKCMWYEWCVIKPGLSPIHNVKHRSYQVDFQ